jgi:TM2 domain-containing membrane protein YozV
MELRDAESILMMYSSKLSPEYIPTIKEKLLALDRTAAITAFSDLKDPQTALIISICEFFIAIHGISRFYIGDIGIGAAKLLTCGGCGIWWLIDLFLISDATRKNNTQTVMRLLGCY